MKTTFALRFLPALVLAAGLGALPAAAQESDDFSFAKRLAYRGWFDLAGDVCTRIERDTSLPRDVRSALPILLAEIELAKADRESDPDKAMPFISASIDRLQKFIADEPNHPRIFEARINIGYLKSRKAKILVDQIESARTPDKHDKLRKEAAGLYTEVTAEFDDCVAQWRRLPASEEVAGGIMDARLEADRARYEHARIPGIEEVDRKKLLEDAVKNLFDYEIEYGDTAKAFEASLLEGRCLFELGEFAQAETKLKSTLALKDVLEKMKIQRNPYFNQIIFGAYITMAQLYLKTNKSREAEAFIDGVFASDPHVKKDWVGPALKVEKVEALFRLKKSNQAAKEAEELIAADPNSRMADLMREKLSKMNRSGIIKLEPKEALNAAEASISRGRLREAMINLRQTVENCTTAEAKEKYLPKALYLMGQCMQDMRRNYEAALNYEKSYAMAPTNTELSPLALWQAVICYSEEFDTFEDVADEREKNRVMDLLVKSFPNHPVTDNIYYLQGRTKENTRKLVEAADIYLKVPERAPAYERSLVRAAYCLRADAFMRHSQLRRDRKLTPEATQGIVDQLNRSETLFKQFLARLESHPAKNVEEARDRESLIVVVNQELAYLYNHELIGRAKDSLTFLDKVAKDLQPDDERMARIHRLQIQSQIVLNMTDEAVKTLELMYDRFPHAKETAEACKSVAIRLDEITTANMKALPPGAPLADADKENLKKISRYYRKWVDGALAYSMNITVMDMMSVGETLYFTARRLNNVPDTVNSFMDLRRGQIIGWKNYFEDAEFVHSLLVGDQFKGKYAEKDRLILMMRHARCLSFIADSADGWTRAKSAYENTVKEYKVVVDGKFDSKPLLQHPPLVGFYLELGAVYYEMGKWVKIHYDNAITAFSDMANVAAHNSEPWWIARYMSLMSFYKRGKDKDIMTAQVGLKMIQDNYPDFDGGKYGLKEKFLELKKNLDAK